MIRNETEYRELIRRVREGETRLREQRKKLEELGLGPEEVKRAMDPMSSFHEQLREELEGYERLQCGGAREPQDYAGPGS